MRVPFFTAMVIGVLGEMSDAPSAGDAVIAAAGSSAGGVEETVLVSAVVVGAVVAGPEDAADEDAAEEDPGAEDAAEEDPGAEDAADVGAADVAAPLLPAADTAPLTAAGVWPVTAPVGAAVDPAGVGTVLLPPFALEFDVQAAAASRLSESMATVARRPHRVGWAAVNMLVLGLCWRWTGTVQPRAGDAEQGG